MGRFARYELAQRIAVGGMAEVWAARGIRSDGSAHDLVMKRILPTYAGDADFQEMLFEEARVTALLRHPKIVQTLDWGKLDETCFIAMERVTGVDARGLLNESANRNIRLPPAVGLHIAAEVLDALDHAHRATDPHGEPLGIVHRDVSPANILLGIDGRVKLSDFGIARAKIRASRTQVGQVRGKPRYMSPEQARGEPLDGRSDVFSVGLVLYELLTGDPALPGGAYIEEVILSLEREVPRPSQANPDFRVGIDELIARLCERDRARRFPTAGVARDAILEVAARRNLRLHPAPVAELVQSIVHREAAEPLPMVTRIHWIEELSRFATQVMPIPDEEDVSAKTRVSTGDTGTTVLAPPDSEATVRQPIPQTIPEPIPDEAAERETSKVPVVPRSSEDPAARTQRSPVLDPDDTERNPWLQGGEASDFTERRPRGRARRSPWVAPIAFGLLFAAGIVALVLLRAG